MYSGSEEEFKNKYSKETLALVSFINSRKQIYSPYKQSMKGYRNYKVDSIKRARSMNKLDPHSGYFKDSKISGKEGIQLVQMTKVVAQKISNDK